MTISTQTRKLILPKLHPAQRTICNSPVRFKVGRCGRRFGKSLIARDEIVLTMLAGRIVVYTAPTYGMLKDMWRSLIRFVTFNHIPHYKNASDMYLRFPNGGQLTMWSLDAPDTIRGGNAHLIINDECAFVPKLMTTWTEVLMPMLLDFGGSAYFFSTPNGHNDFWQLSQMGDDPLQPHWQSFHYSTYDNPHIDPAEIDLLKSTLTQRAYEQEILAQFAEDAGMVFRNVKAVSTLQPREPYRGEFVFGIDFARDNDFTVISVMDRQTRQQVAIDRFNQIGWTVQRGRIQSLYDKWQPETIIAERNSIGDVNIEALQNEGLPVVPFVTTATSKPPLIDALALAIERGEIGLLDDPVQRGELDAYSLARLPSGGYKYSAPSGGHDDTCMALALAWHGVNQPVFSLDFDLQNWRGL